MQCIDSTKSENAAWFNVWMLKRLRLWTAPLVASSMINAYEVMLRTPSGSSYQIAIVRFPNFYVTLMQ